MFELTEECYVILSHNNKNKLALVTSMSKSTINAYLNDDLEGDDAVTAIKVPVENIIANLGLKPKTGAAYGVKIEPFIGSEELEQWGTLAYYRIVPKKEKKHMFAALERTIDNLDKKGLAIFVPVKLEIREHNGKHLGFYKHVKKEGMLDSLCLKPPAFDLEPEDIDYIIYHEAAHGIWHKGVNATLRALWVKMFEKRVKCKNIKQKELDSILETIYQYKGGTIKDFIRDEASDEEQDIVKECLKYMSKVYRLSAENVDVLLAEDNIDKYWPTQQDISKVYPDISEYSMKSPEEFFAEVFAHRMLKHSLPKDTKTLMEQTIDHIKGR